MPQGWCCWLLPLDCCAVSQKGCCAVEAASKHTGCCCQPQQDPCDETAPSPVPVRCSKCIYDVTKPLPVDSVDSDAVFAAILPWIDLYALSSEPVTLVAHHFGEGPPLHLVLCVWRC